VQPSGGACIPIERNEHHISNRSVADAHLIVHLSLVTDTMAITIVVGIICSSPHARFIDNHGHASPLHHGLALPLWVEYSIDL